MVPIPSSPPSSGASGNIAPDSVTTNFVVLTPSDAPAETEGSMYNDSNSGPQIFHNGAWGTIGLSN